MVHAPAAIASFLGTDAAPGGSPGMPRPTGTIVSRALAAGAAIWLASCSAVETTSADRFVRSGELVALSGGRAGAANACFTCHGLDGLGNAAGAPRLAGLNVGYIAGQLEAYADGRRQDAQMQWIAGRLSRPSRQSVAAYYAGMTHEPSPAELPSSAGRLLYHRGDPARGLRSCAECHGEAGEGVGAGNPPLGNQPASYLAEQIERWRHGQRRNDPDGVMQRISRLLTPQEALALSAYAAKLPGDLPRPEPPEAFRAGHRVDPRSGV